MDYFFCDLNADEGKDPERVVASWDVLMFTTSERQNDLLDGGSLTGFSQWLCEFMTPITKDWILSYGSNKLLLKHVEKATRFMSVDDLHLAAVRSSPISNKNGNSSMG